MCKNCTSLDRLIRDAEVVHVVNAVNALRVSGVGKDLVGG